MTTNADLCPDCGHNGYDGHDMRSIPSACLTFGCWCGNPFTPEPPTTLAEVKEWFAAMTLHSNVPHPDDSAAAIAWGSADLVAVFASPFAQRRYDAAMDAAVRIAGGDDIYRLIEEVEAAAQADRHGHPEWSHLVAYGPCTRTD